MQFLLLLNPDDSLFDASSVERALRSCPQFTDFHRNDIDLIECQYKEPDDWTTIRLGNDRETISVDSTRGASLRAVLLIQKALGRPLRVFDDDGTFDLTFSDIATVEELEAAMDKARTF
jgi:hypothetical protein